jgi:hypothetical protein
VSVPDAETRAEWSRRVQDGLGLTLLQQSAALDALEEAERRAETAEQLVFSCPVCSWQLLAFAAAGGGAGPGEEPTDD